MLGCGSCGGLLELAAPGLVALVSYCVVGLFTRIRRVMK